MKKLLLLAFFGPLLVLGQNGIIGTGFSPTQGSQVDWSNIKYFSNSIQSTRILTVYPNGIGNQYFRLVRGWSGNNDQYGPFGCTDQAWNSSGISYNLSQCWNGAFYINCPNTTDRYIFKTPGGDFPNQKFVYFRIQGPERTILSLANSNETIYTNQTKSISATLSGPLATGQGVYLRYTINGWFSSTVVPMTVTGTTATASIPGFSSGTNVSYYLFSSGSLFNASGVLADGSNADYYAFNWLNNDGANYSYTVACLAPSITAETLNAQTVCQSAILSQLSVSATGDALSYQWYSSASSSNVGGSLISAATSATYTPSSAAASTKYYYCVVTGACGTATSNASGAIVVNAIPSTPSISAGTSTSLCPGEEVTLTSSAASGNQWYKNGTALSGSTAATLTTSESGAYTVISTVNGCASSASSPTAVDMNTVTAITQQPSASTQSVLSGANLVVNATGTNLQFQWQVSTNSGSTWTVIAAPAGIASFYNPSPSSNSIYRCEVTGTCGTVTSDASGLVTAIPVVTLSNASCSNTLNSMSSGISATNVPNASAYRFTITPSGSQTSYQVTSPDRWFALTEATGMALYYGTQYSVTAEIQGSTGAWGAAGAACTVTTPSIPTTTLSNNSCGQTLTSMSSGISANNVHSAAMYRFTITPSIPNASSYTVDSPDRWIALTEATGMPLWYGTNYSITVAVQNGTGTWGNPGNPCTVTTPTLPTTMLSQTSCGTILSSMSSGISANNVQSAAQYRFTITPVIPNATSYTIDSPDRWIALTEATGMPLWYGTNYSITVAVQNGTGTWGNPGNPCTVTTPTLPTTMLSQTSCGAILSSLSAGISANNVQSAAQYRFTITPVIPNATSYEVNSPDRWIALAEASGMPLLYGTSYSIVVAVQNGSGAWGNPGNPCTVTTPAIPTIGLSTTSCGATLQSLGSGISATNVAAATQYEFQIINQTAGQAPTEYYVISPDRWIALSEGMTTTNSPLVPQNNQQYVIRVRAYSGTQFGEYAEVGCIIYTPVTQGMIVQDQDPQLHEEQTEGMGNEESSNVNAIEDYQVHMTTWTATATSNPFAHSFHIKLNGAEGINSAASFTTQLTDMSGKVYSQATLSKEQLEAESFGEQLAPGMYLMTLRNGEELRVIRVVKR